MLQLRSFIPGRARWQVDEIEARPGLTERLEKLLAVRPGILEAHGNPVSARILLRFDVALDAAQLEGLILACLGEAGRLRDHAAAAGRVSRGEGAAPLERLMRHATTHETLVRRLIAVAAIQRIIDASMPIFIGLAVDAVTGPSRSVLGRLGFRRAPTQILVVSLFGLACWIAKAGLSYLERRLSSELTQRMQHRLRVDAYERLQRLDMAFLDESRAGGLVSNIDGDVGELEALLENGLKPFLGIAANALTAGVTFLVLSPGLALIQVLVIPALIWGTVTFVAPARRRFGVVRERASELSSVLVGNIEGMSTIRAFATEEREAERVTNASAQLLEANLSAMSFVATLEPFLELGVGIGFVLTVLVGGRQVLLGAMSPGSFNTLSFMSMRLLSSIAFMGVTIARMQRFIAALERVFELLDQQPTVPSGDRHVPREGVAGEIRFADVTFSYHDGAPVLRKLSLTVPAGKTVAIVGSTGAGKSTVLKLLLRFYEYGDGRIELDGTDIRDLDTTDLRRAIAFVGQEVFLFHGTVRENIAYGREGASDDEIAEAARLAAAADFIADLPGGYDAMVGERGAKLSGGQRQRIAIARALLAGAPILAMDEATSSVDNETEAAIQRSLSEAVAGKTKIVIAHRLSTIRHADHIYVMDEGAVVEEGRHDALIAQNGLYASFWRVQTGERNPTP